MLKKILITIAFIGSFVAGIFVASIMHFGAPIITIDFINNADKDIQSIQIMHEMGRDNIIQYQIAGLKTGKEKRIHLYAPAESSYELTITFADGNKLTGGAGYVEAGYKVKEVVKKDKIESKADLFGSYKR